MYYDLLQRIKNAQAARKETLVMPFSKLDFAVAQALAVNGFLKSAEKRVTGHRTLLEIKLKYGSHGGVVTNVRLVSKPSRRMYMGYQELHPVRQSFGISILSTPKGILSNRDARKQKVGGEVLFEIW